MQNDGYRVLRTLRGSPPYWETAKRDLFALVRQLGIPTWFCSFSAAETKWVPLLKSLVKLVHQKDVSTTEIENMSWQEKCVLIKSDPVTCARFFDHRVQVFITHVLKHPSHPVGEILDFFYRVEFQQRGSPHIHMVVWIKGAPVHGISSNEEITAFIDKYIACCKNAELPELINYQTHRHASTCMKNGKTICRFGFPIPPMLETQILHPISEAEETVPSGTYERMMSCLNEINQAQTDITFQQLLNLLEMDHDTYIKAIRSSLSRPKVFLKRSVLETRINNYNPVLLKCWKANMDMQYILDPYSCVSYIVSYISKGQRGLSNLLRDACNEARELDSDVRQQVRRIGNQFLSSVEIGAQEAAYLALQMPLRRCTREVVYIDTKMPEDRTCLIKSFTDLKELPSTSMNIEMDNVLKRYKRRPRILKHLSYADFVSWYDLVTERKKDKPERLNDENELPEEEYQSNNDEDVLVSEDNEKGKIVRFVCGTQIRKRARQKVIYSHMTPINSDREEHFREQIMLYSSWRNEEDLIAGFESYEQSFKAKEARINLNKSQYEKNEEISYENMCQEFEADNFCAVVNPEVQHMESLDAEEGCSDSSVFGCFDPGVGSALDEDYDIGEDLGINRTRVCTGGLPSNEMDDEQYLQSVRSLNIEQKKIFYYILKKVKTRSLPFYIFLSGGAGCGKSVVIRTLHQALLKHFNHLRNESPDRLKLLLCAPTGKAAHNIGGSTIHSAFCIPANQRLQFKPLDMQQLNTMRALYSDLKVVIIDEISMVGRAMLNFINLRLQEIKGCSKPFGEVSILAVGDLYQLKPVLDSWVFSSHFSSTQYQCLGTNLWMDLFQFFELREIMRQKDDSNFAVLLNRLREGEHTDEDLAVLKNRQIEHLGINRQTLKHMTHLFCRRVDVSSHNELILSQIPCFERISVEAIDSVSGNINASLHDVILSKIPQDASKTMGLQKKLELGLSMPAELCSNIDTTDGLTNGASCHIRKFDFRVENSSRCSIVWVEFDDKTIGKKWRTKYRHLYIDGVLMSWTPILETSRRFAYKFYKTYQIVRRQFPLYISAGKTIHKAQGSTILRAVLDFGSRKIDHIHYVGLSRVSNLSGVFILNFNPDKISVSAEVQSEMERLRSQKQIEGFPNTAPTNDNILKICFQNCRSLKKHIEDVKNEQTLLSADIIGFVETRISNSLPTGNFEIDGFRMISSESVQAAHGISIYYKSKLDVNFLTFKTVNGIEYGLVSLIGNIVVCFVYCPPKIATLQNVSTFLSSVVHDVSTHFTNSVSLLLMGDFNFEFSEHCAVFQVFKDRLGLKQLINCTTTDYESCIDHIYTDLPCHRLKDFGTLESYYSDHKVLYIEVGKSA